MRLEVTGYCPICEAPARFVAVREGDLDPQWHPNWFRDGLSCVSCHSIPRERAIAHVLNGMAPDWRQLKIHEAAPGGRGVSAKLRRMCQDYLATQYSVELPFGQKSPNGQWQNENLEAQTFADGVFDVVITQDVFEHLFNPGRAAREIARTLKTGGLCLMTVPVVRGWGETQRRASLIGDEVFHHLPEQYHGNPVGNGRSLVTIDWGYDIGAYLSRCSGLSFTVSIIDNMQMGIRDPRNVVLAARKAVEINLGESDMGMSRLMLKSG